MALHAKLACTLFGLSLLALCHAQCSSPISKHCSFVDHFTGDPEKLWEKADDYANGEPFNVWWSKNNAVFNRRTGRASLFLNKRWGPRHGKKYAGGHLKSKNWYGYGCYEVRLKPALQSGVVSAFFAYAGKYDRPQGGNGLHNEIDIEFIPSTNKGQWAMQTNYFANHVGHREHVVPLRFNPTEKFHNYAFKWTSRGIAWYVDGQEVYRATKGTPLEKDSTLRIMANLWAVSKKAEGWAGKFVYTKELSARYEAVRFTRGEHCRVRGFPPQRAL